ncbi:MAG: FliM/FliN family flagellar motor switch protein [Myxococcota bacterium]
MSHRDPTRMEGPPPPIPPSNRRPENKDRAPPLGDLPVLVSLELDRLEVTAARLARLEPGWVLPFSASVDDLVHLYVRDHWVGSGRLVEIDGRVGVRITEMAESEL